MRKWFDFKTAVLILLMVFCGFLKAVFATGVDDSSLIEKVQIGSGKTAQQFVLLNSRINSLQWYCAKLSPKLIEFKSGDSSIPDLTLIRFQHDDPGNHGKLLEGGILQFGFDIGADEATIRALKSKLPRGVDQRLARIDPLPLTGIDMTIFDPMGKKVELVATPARGIASDYASEYANFTANFVTMQADLVESLLNLPTGIKFELKYRYSTLSEPINTVVDVDFDKLSEKSGNKDDYNLVDHNGKTLSKELSQYLKRQASNPRIMQRIRSRAEREKADSNSESKPNSYDPKSDGRKPSESEKSSGSADKISKMLEQVVLINRSRAEKFLAAEGFLSLSGYSDEIKKSRVIEDLGYENWKFAYLMMPVIGDIPGLNVAKIDLKVDLTDGQHVFCTRKYQWKQDTQWLNEEKSSESVARISLKDVFAAGSRTVDKATFKMNYSIYVANDSVLTGEFDVPVFTGDLPLASPFELADVMMFDFSNLYWDAPESDKSRLLKVEIIVQDDRRQIRRFVAPVKGADNVIVYPEQVPILLGHGNFEKRGMVKTSVFFRTADNKRIAWEFNGMELSKAFSGAYLSFLDNDWHKD
ncbi:MAG: hypothetical protein KKB51_08440 [Candidatus Riflebacteria bacterium]|nr:hypothetical protein [Candidatus Riflebacteria bacterium]